MNAKETAKAYVESLGEVDLIHLVRGRFDGLPKIFPDLQLDAPRETSEYRRWSERKAVETAAWSAIRKAQAEAASFWSQAGVKEPSTRAAVDLMKYGIERA